MDQIDTESDSDEYDDDALKELKEKQEIIIKTLYPTSNLRRVGDIDKTVLLRRAKETLSFQNRIKSNVAEDAETDNSRKWELLEENTPGPSGTAAASQDDRLPLLPPTMLPRRMVDLKIDVENEDVEKIVKDSGIKSRHAGIIDSSIPLRKAAAKEDLQIVKKFQGLQFNIGMEFEETMKDTPMADTSQKPTKTDNQDTNVTKKVQTTTEQAKHKKSDTPQKSVQTKLTESKEDEKSHTTQKSIKTDMKEVSVTIKLQTKSKEIEDEKFDTPQTPLKTHNEDLHAVKMQSKLKRQKEDHKRQDPATSVTKKVQIKSKEIEYEKFDTPQTPVKTHNEDLSATKMQFKLKRQKEDHKIQGPLKTVSEKVRITEKETKKEEVSLPEKISKEQETKMKEMNITKSLVFKLIVLVTSTMESIINCFLLEEKINRKIKEACKCGKKREILTKNEKPNVYRRTRNTSEGGNTFYVDKAIQHVMFVIIYTEFPNINFFQLGEIKIK